MKLSRQDLSYCIFSTCTIFFPSHFHSDFVVKIKTSLHKTVSNHTRLFIPHNGFFSEEMSKCFKYVTLLLIVEL